MTAPDRPFADLTDQQFSDYMGDVDTAAANHDRNDSAVRAGERCVAEVNARKAQSRLLRTAVLLVAAIFAALALAGCQNRPAPSPVPSSFWPCPAGQTFTQHHQVWGCFK